MCLQQTLNSYEVQVLNREKIVRRFCSRLLNYFKYPTACQKRNMFGHEMYVSFFFIRLLRKRDWFNKYIPSYVRCAFRDACRSPCKLKVLLHDFNENYNKSRKLVYVSNTNFYKNVFSNFQIVTQRKTKRHSE